MKIYELTAAGWIAMPAAVLTADFTRYPKLTDWKRCARALLESGTQARVQAGPDLREPLPLEKSVQASDRAGGSRKEQRTGKSPAGSAADARRRMLQKRFPAPFLRKMEEQLPVWDGGRIREIAEAYGTRCIREIGEGGILDVLWNVAETFDAGLSADMKKIPIRQETIEICELFGIDPYYSLSWDAYLIVSESGETLASVIRGTGIPAAVIGHLEDSSARTLLCGTHTRYLDRPKPDSLLAFLAGKPCAW